MADAPPATLAELCALARQLHQQLVQDECEEAQELGFHPHIALLPGESETTAGALATISAILTHLVAGRRTLLRRLRAVLDPPGEDQPPPRRALRARIHDLAGLLGAGAREVPADESMRLRLRQMEQEAEHRQLVIEKLVHKAFEQGELIGDLRLRLDRINAMAGGEAAEEATTTINEDLLVVHDDEDDLPVLY